MRKLNARNLQTYLHNHTWFLDRFEIKGFGVDIGCGDGIFLSYLMKRYPLSLVGLELSEESCNFARLSNPDVEIVNAPAENTGFGDNSFDFVFVNSVLHHVRNPLVVVDELIRIAAGNSFIVLVEPRRINPLIIAHSILKKHERGQLKLEFNKIKNHFKKSRFVNRIVEFPVNSLIYPYQNFPPKNIYPLICKFESVFRLRPISTHRALVVEIRK